MSLQTRLGEFITAVGADVKALQDAPGVEDSVKISDLTAATLPLAGTELLPIVQSSASKKIAAADLLKPSWAGKLHSAYDNGDPDVKWQHPFLWAGAPLTPTLITATVGRIWAYQSPYAITVNRLRWLQVVGTAAASNFRFGIYNPANAGAAQQILAPQTLTFTANADTWSSHNVGGVVLAANTLYYMCLSATAVSTVWSMRATGPTLAGPPLQATEPGNLALAAGANRHWFGQVALTAGVQPSTMPTLVKAPAWATAGLPGLLLDNSTAA